jgi:hypothetical protein
MHVSSIFTSCGFVKICVVLTVTHASQADAIAKIVELRRDIDRLETLLEDTREAVVSAQMEARRPRHYMHDRRSQTPRPTGNMHAAESWDRNTRPNTPHWKSMHGATSAESACSGTSARRSSHRKMPYSCVNADAEAVMSAQEATNRKPCSNANNKYERNRSTSMQVSSYMSNQVSALLA